MENDNGRAILDAMDFEEDDFNLDVLEDKLQSELDS
jgi:hypothetical protein